MGCSYLAVVQLLEAVEPLLEVVGQPQVLLPHIRQRHQLRQAQPNSNHILVYAASNHGGHMRMLKLRPALLVKVEFSSY